MRLKKGAAERATAEKLEAEKVRATSPQFIDESAQGQLSEAEIAPAAISQFESKCQN